MTLLRLTNIPGIGPLNATAPVAAVGDALTFARGRSRRLRQATTGGKPRLLGITKRGSSLAALIPFFGHYPVLPFKNPRARQAGKR
jgi:transposase